MEIINAHQYRVTQGQILKFSIALGDLRTEKVLELDQPTIRYQESCLRLMISRLTIELLEYEGKRGVRGALDD